MIGYFISIVILFLGVIVLSVLFYFLNKRQDAMDQQISEQLSKMQTDIELLQQNCSTLRQNDDILAKDIETLLHELKKFEKKTKHNG